MSGIGSGHNKIITCKNCPHETLHPDCRMQCEGYKVRVKGRGERRIFISQPMRGRDEEQILQEKYMIYHELLNYNEDKEIHIIDNILDLEEGVSPLEYLAESIRLMSHADLVVFAPQWSDYRGCRLEYLACVEYGIPVILL